MQTRYQFVLFERHPICEVGRDSFPSCREETQEETGRCESPACAPQRWGLNTTLFWLLSIPDEGLVLRDLVNMNFT